MARIEKFEDIITWQKASGGETRAHLYIEKNQKYITEEEFIEVSKTVSDFVSYLKANKNLSKFITF